MIILIVQQLRRSLRVFCRSATPAGRIDQMHKYSLWRILDDAPSLADAVA